jgi:hypothetical protein
VECLLNIYKSKVCVVQNTSSLFLEPADTVLDNKGKLQLASSSLIVKPLTPAQEHLTPAQYHCQHG